MTEQENTYEMYAEELKKALIKDQITRLVIYGNDGTKIVYERKPNKKSEEEQHEHVGQGN